VIDEDGTQLGIMTPDEARRLADSSGLDLVEVAPTANPPVCRIMDYGKYRYEQSKRAHEAKKHQKTIQVKEVKFRPKIDEHDYEFKKNHAVRFLKAQNKVKATIMFRGREVTHPEIGRQILERLTGDLEEFAVVERDPKLEGYNMTMILSPKRD
jgi:translation initiation factor IF-3